MELASISAPSANKAEPSPTPTGYELRFRSLYREGMALSFACNSRGEVDMNTLSPRALDNYLYARTTLGCEFSLPTVLPTYA